MEVKSNTVKQTIHVSEFQKRAQQYSWNLVCKGYMGDKSIQQRFVWRFEKKILKKAIQVLVIIMIFQTSDTKHHLAPN